MHVYRSPNPLLTAVLESRQILLLDHKLLASETTAAKGGTKGPLVVVLVLLGLDSEITGEGKTEGPLVLFGDVTE